MTRLSFNRMEIAGSLGDLGALLPIAIAMVILVGMPPTGVFACIGLYYILSGCYFQVTTPVQPMKVVGAYAIATALEPGQIVASALLAGVFLLIIGLTGGINFIHRHSPKSVIRGVQLSTGILLMSSGIHLILGDSPLQTIQGMVEPSLRFQEISSLPTSLILGVFGAILLLLFWQSKRFPAALVVILFSIAISLLFGKEIGELDWGMHLPEFLPFGFPSGEQLSFALLVLILPQLPMTMGNAVLAYSDLSRQYFGKKSHRVTNKAICISMGLANIGSFLLGGMPLCHGAGGLAAHYRFGARTAASNIFIGGIFLLIVLLLGESSIKLFSALPLSLLGAMLIFAGAQLALTISDLKKREELFIAVVVLAITLASNLAAGFIIGLLTAKFMEKKAITL